MNSSSNSVSESVDQQIATIKRSMRETYQTIGQYVERYGNDVYGIVRRGLRGEPDCFYACEAGQVVGTPFSAGSTVAVASAQLMVQFGFESIFMLDPTKPKPTISKAGA